MLEQANGVAELLRDMQQDTDNMSAMLQYMCRAMGIDYPSLSDSFQDEESSIAVSDASFHTLSEIEISEYSSNDIDSDASHSV